MSEYSDMTGGKAPVAKKADEAALLDIIKILQKLPAEDCKRVLRSVCTFFGLDRRDG